MCIAASHCVHLLGSLPVLRFKRNTLFQHNLKGGNRAGKLPTNLATLDPLATCNVLIIVIIHLKAWLGISEPTSKEMQSALKTTTFNRTVISSPLLKAHSNICFNSISWVTTELILVLVSYRLCLSNFQCCLSGVLQSWPCLSWFFFYYKTMNTI